MATRRIDIKDYCESLYTELFGMKSRIGEFVTTIEQMEGEQKKALNPHLRHLNEMISFIDWKLEIFYKVCPVDLSRFGQDFESIVSVPPVETLKEGDQPAAGDIGG
jgi:hypothetical protein